MTTADPNAALRQFLAAPTTRSRLTAYARRRGLGGDADDLAQSVLCDALAARTSSVPRDPSEFPRWVTGIARHKVADAHRSRRRWVAAAPPEPSHEPRPEHRDLLLRIERDATSPAVRAPLGWLLREEAGDRLVDLAREAALCPESLRQRICRLRRHLRARYALPLVALLVIGGGWLAREARPSPPPAPAVSVPNSYVGRWRVAELRIPHGKVPSDFSVWIEGDQVRLLSGELTWAELNIQRMSPGEVVLERSGRTWRAKLTREGSDTLRLSSSDGSVLLRRER